jgi:hypothetical protein
MRIHPLLLGAAALLLHTVALAAQPGGAALPPGMPGAADERPFARLMELRAALELSDAQVARLSEIAARLEETNRPLRAELFSQWQAWREQRRAELLRMTPSAREAELRRLREEGPPPLPESMRPLAQRIRGNVAAAMGEAGGVLTPRQKARARQLVRQERIRRNGGFRPRRGGLRRP